MTWDILGGDCVGLMAGMEAGSVDAVVCDPPYGIGFMNKGWDRPTGDEWGYWAGSGKRPSQGEAYAFQAFSEAWAGEALRVLKPGGHLLAFGGTRTYHRLVCALEDAGFEIRDCLVWLYGSGFPKSFDVSKALDKRRDWSLVERLAAEIKRARDESGMTLREIGAATLAATGGVYGTWYHKGGHMFFETGRSLPSRPEWDQLRHLLPIAPEFVGVYEEAERDVIGVQQGAMAGWSMDGATRFVDRDVTVPATDDAKRWEGWGTALKPAHEPIVLARKPLVGTVAGNVLEHGTGGLNVDGCRIETSDDLNGGTYSGGAKELARPSQVPGNGIGRAFEQPAGRWPANVILDEQAAALLDEQTGELHSQDPVTRNSPSPRSGVIGFADGGLNYADRGGASRFFYIAKASRTERNAGLEGPSCVCGTVKPWAEHEGREDSQLRGTSALTETAGSDCSTSGNGSKPTGQSRTGSRSITETESRPTTGSQTSSLSPPQSTSGSTRRTSDVQETDGSGGAGSAANGNPPTASTTTSVEKGGSSTDDAAPVTSPRLSETSNADVCPDCGGVSKGAFRNTHPT